MPNRITRPTCAAISTVHSTNRAAKTCRLLGSCSRISASNPTQYRPRQTVEGLATTLNLPTNTLSFHESLYLALPQTLAQAAATFPDSVQTGLLFAHNPGLEEWVAQLTGCPRRATDRRFGRHPTRLLLLDRYRAEIRTVALLYHPTPNKSHNSINLIALSCFFAKTVNIVIWRFPHLCGNPLSHPYFPVRKLFPYCLCCNIIV